MKRIERNILKVVVVEHLEKRIVYDPGVLTPRGKPYLSGI